MKYDVIVVGGGPAGATFARCADKNMKILLLDGSRQLFSGKGKACGGLLAPDAQAALAHFDLSMPKDILVSPQIFSVKTIDVASGIERHYRRSYLNMDRRKFDEWLLSLVGENVTVKRAVCTEIEYIPGGCRVTYRDENGKTDTSESKYLVGADGASSAVRKSIYPDFHPRSYTAIQQRFDCGEITPFYSCIFDRKATDCCAWSICKDGELIFGGAYPTKNCRERFEEQKKRLEKHGFSFGEPKSTEACVVLRPRSARDFFCGRDGVFLLGEAAGFISPSSLEGISFAIRSGEALSDVLGRKKNPAGAYKKATAGLRFKLILKTFKCPFMYVPFLRKIVMKSGLMSVKIK